MRVWSTNELLALFKFDDTAIVFQKSEASDVKTILTSELVDFINEADGVVSLVGDHGARVLITGEVAPSGVMQGCHMIETEVGTLYVGDEIEILVVDGD
jgi:hypothetical protein